MKSLITFLAILLCMTSFGQVQNNFVKENFNKTDTLIGMRDGVKLYTVIYTPRTMTGKMAILLERTPYSAGPYGDTNYARRVGPNPTLSKEPYIFVYQDVRGRYMSEGTNLEVTPNLANKKTKKDVDESSDTYDTVDWLTKNLKNNNGRVGIYGISYPGFYATASLPGAHPAIKAVSPQAPVTDEFVGDDANHNGAFFLMDNFDFMNYFGKPRSGPIKDYGDQVFNADRKNAYDFFLKLGPISNSQSAQYFNHKSYIWDEYLQHDTYDSYWKARNIRPYLQNITIPTLVVGGWFDAEDLFGALNTYSSIEAHAKPNKNHLVMGPWTHGAWESSEWKQYASHDFGSNTSKYFQDSIEATFFDFYLRDKGTFTAAEATVFETGSNQWRSYNTWPPANVQAVTYYLGDKNMLASTQGASSGYDEYTSDPHKPVPYTNGIYASRNNDYMAEDQRFAAIRPDVLVYESLPLTADIRLAGKIIADLRVSMTGTDGDFIVKLIDVLPDDEPNFQNAPKGFQMAGYQRMVRAEVMRGKFRNSYEKPEPFIPGQVSTVKFNLNDVAHTFKKGHKIMIQVQSSWFPLVDLNPQKFMRIPEATERDFQTSTIRLYHGSNITLPVVN